MMNGQPPTLSLTDLTEQAALIRADVLKMIAMAGSGHPGGSLSAADILTVLYFGGVLRYDPRRPDWPQRDRFILSKGHVAPVLYASLARAGYFSLGELATLRQLGSRLQGHPDMRKLPGLEASTGSLGQGLSIACGLAYGLRQTGTADEAVNTGTTPPWVITLLGDGECQEGQVWEAALFAAQQQLSGLVAVIDNNGLQIDGPLQNICDVGDLAAKFREFGWYTLNVNGHDLSALQAAFGQAQTVQFAGPRLIVAQTCKGQGVSFMENQVAWHGKAPNSEQLAAALAELAPAWGSRADLVDWASADAKRWGSTPEFDAANVALQSATPSSVPQPVLASAAAGTRPGQLSVAVGCASPASGAAGFAAADSAAPALATRAALGETLVQLAQSGCDVYAVDADLSGSTTTAKLGTYAPSRLVNVGIAEQNMIDVAAGIALTDPTKVVFSGSFAIFAAGRAYDQIRNTVCYANLNVKLAPTHAGISTGADGGSHQMVEDLALMRVLPNMRVLVPADYAAAQAALTLAASLPGPFYIRLGRQEAPQIYADSSGFGLGQARLLRQGDDVSILACGLEVHLALAAAETLAAAGVQAEVIDVFSLKPLDKATLLTSIRKTGRVVSVEEHSIIGGLGSAVSELITEEAGCCVQFCRLGVTDRFGTSGGFAELFATYRLNSQAISETVLELCGSKSAGSEEDSGVQ